MTDYPKISVVTITYGHENYITKTLDGVLMQDYPGEIEFIISNDNSPDATDKVVNRYLSQNKIPENFIIKYTKHEVNKGAITNFSWAIEQALGKYIALCEGDDYWTDLKKLQKQVDFLEENLDYSLCFSAKFNINSEGKIISEGKYDNTKEWTAADVLDGGFIAGLQTIVSINLSKEFNEFCNRFPERTGADRLYSYFYGTKGKLKYLDEITAAYRIHDGGIWSRLSKKEKLVAHIKQHSIFLKEISDDENHFKELQNNMFRLLLKNEYFKFVVEPGKTVKSLLFIFKNYKVSPMIFILAKKDYLEYYFQIFKLKFRSN